MIHIAASGLSSASGLRVSGKCFARGVSLLVPGRFGLHRRLVFSTDTDLKRYVFLLLPNSEGCSSFANSCLKIDSSGWAS